MAVSPQISILSEAELAARCKRNPAEEWLHQSGCLCGLLAGATSGVTVLAVQAAGIVSLGWCPIACLAFMAFIGTGLTIFRLFEGLSRFRCRRYLRELEKRYGLLPLKDYVVAMRPGLAPGETLIVLVGLGRPHGDHWWVCVRISGCRSSGSVEARSVSPEGFGGWPDFGRGAVPEDTLRVARAELAPEAARRVAETAGQLRRSRIEVRSTVIDGFPVECAVLEGTTKRVTTISCNLAGVPPTRASEPHIWLVQEVFSAGTALIDRPSVYGSTDFFTGAIRIDDL